MLTATTAEKGAYKNTEHNKQGKLHHLTENEYETKLTAEAHIDELVNVSKDANPGKPNKKDENNIHGDFAKDGWRYREAFFEDFDGKNYRVIISVAHGTKGKVVYNVAKVRERISPTFSGSSDNTVGAQRWKDSSSEKRIAEEDRAVNSKLSEDSGVTDRELLRETAGREGEALGSGQSFKGSTSYLSTLD